jgi:molybdenum cofactor cytidylyltransferase
LTRPVEGYVALVLAAGASRRMGEGRNKLLEEIEGEALVVRVVDAFLAAGVRRVVVAVGYEAERVRSALAGRPGVAFVSNPAWREGMGRSLAAGVRSLDIDGGEPVSGVLVTVGDLPRLPTEAVLAVLDAHRADPSPRAICLPTHAGRDGHPVLFGAAHFSALAALEGDRGARAIVEANAEHVRRVPVDSDRILRDVDTPEELARARDEIARRRDGAEQADV